MHIFLHEPVGKQNLHAVLGKQGTAQYAHRFKDSAFQLGSRFVVSTCLCSLFQDHDAKLRKNPQRILDSDNLFAQRAAMLRLFSEAHSKMTEIVIGISCQCSWSVLLACQHQSSLSGSGFP